MLFRVLTLSPLLRADERQAPKEVTGLPNFLEGGYESTAAGGKYEAVFKFEPALPAPGEAATSKEPAKPSALFSQQTAFLKPHRAHAFFGVLRHILIFLITRSGI